MTPASDWLLVRTPDYFSLWWKAEGKSAHAREIKREAVMIAKPSSIN